MIKGDLILVPFPFTDLSGTKTRPAMVLYKGQRDVTVAFISSTAALTEVTDVLIEPDALNGLKRTSVLRLSKIATLDQSIVLGKLGELNAVYLNIINANLKQLFGLK